MVRDLEGEYSYILVVSFGLHVSASVSQFW